ncbi:ATP-binding cassette domain-containing protein [Cuniculiplasma sp. SKW3]|uniref:ATP-binding cassette domain-containing protein n=1 Tax=Cuniculiplasma sp. SKW3 TaxID=3400170 RepID=UPI003FD4DD8C
MIELKDVTKFYTIKKGFGKEERIYAVNNISEKFNDGKIYAVFGNSGSGKTTLASIISGYIAQDSGHVYYDGEPLKGHKTVRIVFQDPYASLNSAKDVKWHIETTAQINGLVEDKIWETYEYLGFPRKKYENRLVWTLSGGELQVLSFIIAFAQHPQSIVLDEPFSYLDTMTMNRVMKLIRSTREQILYIYMDNDMNRCVYLSDYLIIMHNGEVVEQGETDKIITNPENNFTKLILNNIPEINKRI